MELFKNNRIQNPQSLDSMHFLEILNYVNILLDAPFNVQLYIALIGRKQPNCFLWDIEDVRGNRNLYYMNFRFVTYLVYIFDFEIIFLRGFSEIPLSPYEIF